MRARWNASSCRGEAGWPTPGRSARSGMQRRAARRRWSAVTSPGRCQLMLTPLPRPADRSAQSDPLAQSRGRRWAAALQRDPRAGRGGDAVPDAASSSWLPLSGSVAGSSTVRRPTVAAEPSAYLVLGLPAHQPPQVVSGARPRRPAAQPRGQGSRRVKPARGPDPYHRVQALVAVPQRQPARPVATEHLPPRQLPVGRREVARPRQGGGQARHASACRSACAGVRSTSGPGTSGPSPRRGAGRGGGR